MTPNGHQRAAPVVHVCCPYCHRDGSFQPLNNIPDAGTFEGCAVGVRACPNQQCRAVVFVVVNRSGKQAAWSYPAARVQFDTTGVPPPVVKTFEEALTNQAEECYMSAGMMLRKTLEVICEDRGAQGNSLHERLKNLREKVIMSTELFEAMGDLKLLGNDAAHAVIKDFEDVGAEEIGLAVDLTKEILKAVYQHKALAARLAAFKKAK